MKEIKITSQHLRTLQCSKDLLIEIMRITAHSKYRSLEPICYALEEGIQEIGPRNSDKIKHYITSVRLYMEQMEKEFGE